MKRLAAGALVFAGLLLAANLAAAQETAPAPVPAPASEPAPGPTSEPPPLATAPTDASPAETPLPAAAAAPVQVQTLSALDLFSTGRDAGLGDDVWKGSSAEIARAVIPALAAKPISPAGAALARRLLAQSATAPGGAGADLVLAVARARALLALGDAGDAVLVLDRTPGVAEHADLSQLAAEAALIGEQDDKACRVADNLTDGRDGLYWLRLRAFCQARAGKTDEAQLTFNLAEPQAKDVTTARLLAAYIAGVGDPGPASLHTGLGFALSRALKLDFGTALPTAAPAISRYWALKNSPPTPVSTAASPISATVAAVVAASGDWAAILAGGSDQAILEHLVDQAAKEAAPKARARLQAAAAILAALAADNLDGEMSGAARAAFADFQLGRSEAAPARLMMLQAAAGGGLKGETALLALDIAQLGGAGGPAPADRCWIIRALDRVGLKADAQAFAVEGLLALKEP